MKRQTPAPEGRKEVAQGVSPGFAWDGSPSPGGAKANGPIAAEILSPLRGCIHFLRAPHGLRRGLLSLASPRLLLALAVAVVGCTTDHRQAKTSPPSPCCVTNAEPTAAFTDQSLYQLDSTWTNDAVQPVQLGALQGRVQVVALFFTSCTYACPILLHDLRRIEVALPEAVRTNTGFTLITLDPERDTPTALHAYRQAHRLPRDRWTLLCGGADDTLELAALLGVKFKREASGQFAHSNLITLLSAEGEILHQLVGLNQDVAEAVKRIASTGRDTTKLPAVLE